MSVLPAQKMICAIASNSASQAQAIREATLKSLLARDLYSDQVARELTKSLKSAQGKVHGALLGYKSLGSLPDNKLAALKGLEKLDSQIRETLRTLRKEHTLMFRKSGEVAFRAGMYRGIEEFTVAQMPFYADLTPDGIDKLTTSVFTLIDTDALDFMTNYNLVLAGDIHRELSDGIKRTILSGITTGKGVDDIVRDLGTVIEDKESFQQAGSRVFTKAQYRMEMIARTEILRAHNQGRIKFHQQVGVQRLEWMTMEDERTCPVCGGLDGQQFDTNRFPNQPAHPNCRCTSIVAWPLVICGGELGAVAAGGKSACILPPQAIHEQAKQKIEEDNKLKSAFEGGEIGDLSALTVKQLQTLAKQNGIAVARTKSDFIKLLDKVEPSVGHDDLSGTALQAKIKQYNIAALRSKDELVQLLAQKQAVIKQAKLIEQQMKNMPAPGGLSGLTMVQLKDMAKEHGISLNLTKSEVIEMLDALEPGVDHSGLAGKALIAAKQKYSIPPLKNKEQLVKALEKAAGVQLAEKAKQEALDAAKQQALKAAEQALKDAASNVVVPSSSSQYSDFLTAVKLAESELAKDSGLPADLVKQHATEIALKKQAFQQKMAAMKVGDLKEIAKQTKVTHWQWASKDELLTIFTETDQTKVDAAKASIEAKHAVWAQKHLGKSAGSTLKPAKYQPAAKTTISEPESGPAFAKKGSEFADSDAAWEVNGKPESFKPAGKASVGGAHEKEFWIDDTGNKWLFKPVGKKADEFVAYGEEAAYKIARLIDPDAIEVRTIRLNDRLGSIQRWRSDLAKQFDFYGIAISDITPDEVAQIQREHIIDWLISNHDGHPKQFLRGANGKVYGIDKGQLFKYLGDDRLSIDYHPNGQFGEQEPLYNTLFRAAKQGKVAVDPQVTLRYIREVERISDDDYLAIIKPYVEGRFGSSSVKKKAFYDLALSRKHNLRRDFEGFYAEVLDQPGFRFDEVSDVAIKGRIGKAEEELLDDVRHLGWQGKALPIDENDIEDQNALIFTEMANGQERTVIKLKVRPEAESKILPQLRRADRQTSAPKVGQPLPEDDFAADILAAVKTVNHHAQDGNYNQSTIDKAAKHLETLLKLSKSDDPDIRQMAESYIGWIEKVQQASKDKKPTSGLFEAYLKQHTSLKKQAKDVDYTVRKTKVLLTKRSLKSGELAVAEESADNTSLFQGRSMRDGEQYEVDFGDGVRAVYRPWSDKNHYAQQGEFEIVIPERPDPKSLDKALEHMEKLGLKANIASAEDAELLYLHKQAYISKADHEPDYKAMISDLDARNTSKTERVQAMRSFWEKRLGVSDITRMPGYDPIGEYQLGFKDKSITGGYRHQYRFDISDADIAKEMKGYSLFHNLTNGESMSSFLDTVLGNNGAMISTVEKLRAGVTPGGMSPAEDMNSGGATYVFTRIKKSPTVSSGSAGLYFKNRLLRRMDAISYSHDAFGKVKDDYVTQNRGADPKTWKDFSHNSSNETIFKYSITLLDNLECIVVNSQMEKKKVLDVFKKHGISILPDGRKVEEIVLER